jgi:hypothetical protein
MATSSAAARAIQFLGFQFLECMGMARSLAAAREIRFHRGKSAVEDFPWDKNEEGTSEGGRSLADFPSGMGEGDTSEAGNRIQ